MLFVTHYHPYRYVGIQKGVQRMELIDDGTYQPMILRAHLEAEFHRGSLPFAAREAARLFFDAKLGSSRGEPPGAYRVPGVASDPDFQGYMYDASDEPLFYSFFDTETDCPVDVIGMTDDEVRAKYEKVLGESQELRNGEFILIEQPRVAVPWPSYASIVTGPGHTEAWVAKKILDAAEITGADLRIVAAFERENLNREYVLAALAEETQRRMAAESEVEALSA